MLKKWIEGANDRDQVIAEWLNWLCDNGSVFGRADALGAIQAGLPDRARELLDRYIALPEATEKDKARQLRCELLLANSVPDAAELARKLSDQELRSHLRDGARRSPRDLRLWN